MSFLDKLSVAGFKSIASLEDLELGRINVLVGANGAGKSNFVGLFRFLRAIMNLELQAAVLREHGGASRVLHLGPKVTERITASFTFGLNTYAFSLAPSPDDTLFFERETAEFRGLQGPDAGGPQLVLTGHRESGIPAQAKQRKGNEADHVLHAISSWTVYHFHDTSRTAGVKQVQSIRDTDALRFDASNLAPFLMHLRDHDTSSYQQIRDVVRLIFPAFDDFVLRERSPGSDSVLLEWRQRGSDYPFLGAELSDGTLRFCCLAAVLLQPRPPSTVLIDEPELGLHPYALTLLAELVQEASRRTQLVVSTQSPTLLDRFEAKDVIVVDRDDDQSKFRRLDRDALREWLGA
jgi:predicted ATPase